MRRCLPRQVRALLSLPVLAHVSSRIRIWALKHGSSQTKRSSASARRMKRWTVIAGCLTTRPSARPLVRQRGLECSKITPTASVPNSLSRSCGVIYESARLADYTAHAGLHVSMGLLAATSCRGNRPDSSQQYCSAGTDHARLEHWPAVAGHAVDGVAGHSH